MKALEQRDSFGVLQEGLLAAEEPEGPFRTPACGIFSNVGVDITMGGEDLVNEGSGMFLTSFLIPLK